jgi:hypothetical protein
MSRHHKHLTSGIFRELNFLLILTVGWSCLVSFLSAQCPANSDSSMAWHNKQIAFTNAFESPDLIPMSSNVGVDITNDRFGISTFKNLGPSVSNDSLLKRNGCGRTEEMIRAHVGVWDVGKLVHTGGCELENSGLFFGDFGLPAFVTSV